MSRPFFSIIVPAHNSAEFINRCLDSIKMQTFKDYELIVVADNCDDDTAKIALRYTDRLRITWHGQDGLARNEGIDAALGKWILFLDDDDWWVHEYVLEEIYKVAGFFEKEFDMILFDFIWKDKGYTTVLPARMNIAVWSKAFKRELIGNTRFPAIPFTSDRPFMEEILKKSPRTFTMHKLMYYYNFMRKGSQTERYETGREVIW